MPNPRLQLQAIGHWNRCMPSRCLAVQRQTCLIANPKQNLEAVLRPAIPVHPRGLDNLDPAYRDRRQQKTVTSLFSFAKQNCPVGMSSRTRLKTLKESRRRLWFSHLLVLDEKAEDFAVLRVNALTVFGYITAEHFPVSIWDFHGFSFLRRVHLRWTRSLGWRTHHCFSALGSGQIGD